MNELAPVAILAYSGVQVLLTQFCFVHRRYVYLFLKLMITMCKGTVITKLAVSSLMEAFAKFGLLLELIVSSQESSIVPESKWIFLPLLRTILLMLKILTRLAHKPVFYKLLVWNKMMISRLIFKVLLIIVELIRLSRWSILNHRIELDIRILTKSLQIGSCEKWCWNVEVLVEMLTLLISIALRIKWKRFDESSLLHLKVIKR